MVQSFNSGGYEDVRGYIQSNWTFVALIDDGGAEETRIDVPNDSRASFSSGSASNPVEITITVTGGDSDITTPVTLAETASYKTSSSSTSLANDTMTNATLEASNDELTITHQIEHPPQ